MNEKCVACKINGTIQYKYWKILRLCRVHVYKKNKELSIHLLSFLVCICLFFFFASLS